MSYKVTDDLLTVQEISSFLKLSDLTIYKYIKEGRLEAVEFGGHYRVKKSSLEEFIEHQTVCKKGDSE
jgi:excisionase family DNA binding protein